MKLSIYLISTFALISLLSCKKEVNSDYSGSHIDTYYATYKNYYIRGNVTSNYEFPVEGVAITMNGPGINHSITNSAGSFFVAPVEVSGKWSYTFGEKVTLFVQDTSDYSVIKSVEINSSMLIENDTIKLTINL